MDKIIEFADKKYSLKSFDDYETRIIVEGLRDGEAFKVDIYTTENDTYNLHCFLNSRPKIDSYKIVHMATRAQDDAASKFIDEWLNEDE